MRVLVVDDHPLVRKGLISTLDFEKDVEEIQEASNVEEAMSILSKDRPEVTILDLYLGKEDGLEIVDKARNRKIDSKFIVFTSSSRKRDFERAKSMDVDAYILKAAITEDILYAFKAISRGKKFYDSDILENKYNASKETPLDELTERELEVLKLLGQGYSNKQIANELFISEHTVKKHVSSILEKLELSHRTEAALLANTYFSLNIH
ncbi:MAG: response regulator transcription factor [Clostridiaceae bacterium]|nr:response regulator transcription factor [Clostridiaceae bacterium]